MEANQIVTVVNRTSRPLNGTFNGRPYDIQPGENRFTLQEARYFRFQNPVMGRGTPLEDWNIRSEYLIGIKELGDDCSPMEQTDSPQRWDSTSLNGPNTEIIRPRGASSGEVRSPAPAASEGGFVKP